MFNNRKVNYFQVAQGVWGMKIIFVNIYMIANRRGQGSGWVLVDTGLRGSAKKIIAMAEALFGPGTCPQAIVLTHGHMDHTGALKELLKYWKVPVYAHALEIPYLTGLSSYPPMDPFAGGGLISLLSPLFSIKPINLGKKVKAIDTHDGVPQLPEWKVIHTPGHAPGHISLFLPLNTTLIAGDAITTTKSESLIYALNYLKQLSGPPKYATFDWELAEESAKKLVRLQPRIVATGHGQVMRGRELQSELQALIADFETKAIPATGRYVGHPAVTNETGLLYVPPFVSNYKLNTAIAVAAGFLTFMLSRTIAKLALSTAT